MSTLDPQTDRVLSTLNADGSRRWLRPKPSRGRYWKRRRIVAWSLIAIFTALPHIPINGRPAILIDLPRREFSLFGGMFYPTDTLLLAFLLLSVFLTVFLLTAILGRVWCGWACPQTVYMEFVYRPIERFFDGEPGRARKPGGWRTFAKHLSYLLVSLFLAHTFLAYFVGVDELWRWIRRSPLEHPVSFLVMAAVTGLMLFDFGFFREQLCIVACPYGRMQSVLLDRRSLIVSYDPRRGEPRGRSKRKASKDVALPVLEGAAFDDAPRGDCVDCLKCVATCPTGIDIRDGLQMECVHCTQCIDACDEVMDKLGRPRGLIRYGSQAAIDGERGRFFRPRLLVYPMLLLAAITGFIVTLSRIDVAEITVLRGPGLPFNVLPNGEISNQAVVRVRNRTPTERTFSIDIPGIDGARVIAVHESVTVPPRAIVSEPVSLVLPREAASLSGQDVRVRVTGADGFEKDATFRFRAPVTTKGTPDAQ